jgi:hypothetical protein
MVPIINVAKINMTMAFSSLCLLLLSTISTTYSFQVIGKSSRCSSSALFSSNSITRRQWFQQHYFGLVIATTFLPNTAMADSTIEAVETKTFVDPQGYFAITVPKSFFTIRRSAKGDLPDSKTGQGRRGSSIFTAGNMAKAEVVAVERCVIRRCPNVCR